MAESRFLYTALRFPEGFVAGHRAHHRDAVQQRGMYRGWIGPDGGPHVAIDRD